MKVFNLISQLGRLRQPPVWSHMNLSALTQTSPCEKCEGQAHCKVYPVWCSQFTRCISSADGDISMGHSPSPSALLTHPFRGRNVLTAEQGSTVLGVMLLSKHTQTWHLTQGSRSLWPAVEWALWNGASVPALTLNPLQFLPWLNPIHTADSCWTKGF